MKYQILDIGKKSISSYVNENYDTLMSILLDKLYETEVINGQEISTTDAFYHFCEYVIKYDPITKKRVWNDFVKQQFEIIERNQLSCYMAPRGHGKSYITFILYPIFKSFLVEYFDAVLCSNTPKMTRNNFRKFMRIIDGNELLLEKKGKELGRDLTWNESEIEYNNGFIYTISLGTTPRSAHVCYVAVDDPLRDDNKYTESYIVDYVLGQLKPIILRRKGRMVISGTPQTHTDLFHTLMSNPGGKLITQGERSVKGFFSKRFKAIINNELKAVLVPEIFGYDQLMEEKSTLGDTIFNREYMCECITDETSMFPYSLIKSCVDINLKMMSNALSGKQYCIAVDVATSGEASSDYSAFVVLEVNHMYSSESKKILRHIVWTKGMKVSEQINTIEDLAKTFNNAYVLVEKNNVGVALIQELRDRGVNVDEFITTRTSKEGMLRLLSYEMRKKRILFPAENYELKMLKHELENFGVRVKKGKEVLEAISGHDDLVIALGLAITASQQMNRALPFAICQD